MHVATEGDAPTKGLLMKRIQSAETTAGLKHLKDFMDNQRSPRFRHKTPAQLLELVYEHGDEFSIDFDGWLTLNGNIFECAVEMSWDVRRRGRAHFSICEVWEQIRLNTGLHEDGSAVYKLTNHWRTDVARLIMIAYPDQLSDIFVLHRRNPDLLGCYEPEKAA
jgi:hypothetical protein